MKRLLPVLLSLFLLLPLAACGGPDAGNSDSAAGGNDSSNGSAGYVEGGEWGYAGDTMHTYWFDFTVSGARVCQTFGGYTAASGRRLVVAELSVENTFSSAISLFDADFQIQWGDGDEDFDYPLAAEKFDDSRVLPAEYRLDAGGSRQGLLVYEVPAAGSPDYSVSFQELFQDGTYGDVYFIYFTAGEDGAPA